MSSFLQDRFYRSSFTVLCATGLAVACLPKEDEDEKNDTGWDSGGGYYGGVEYSEAFGPQDVQVTLSSRGMRVAVVDAPGPMSFGFAQTADCAGDTCWQAESCMPDASGLSICHDLDASKLELVPVAAADHLIPSSTTLVGPGLEGKLTFMLDAGTACYTWGHNPSYYADALGCEVW